MCSLILAKSVRLRQLIFHDTLPPSTSALSLTRGPASGGTSLRIFGAGFRDTKYLCVRFGDLNGNIGKIF